MNFNPLSYKQDTALPAVFTTTNSAASSTSVTKRVESVGQDMINNRADTCESSSSTSTGSASTSQATSIHPGHSPDFDNMSLAAIDTQLIEGKKRDISNLFQLVNSRCQAEQISHQFEESRKPVNALKNRYADILSPDTTLSSRDCKPPLYVNASDVTLGNPPSEMYIVTQGPLKNQHPFQNTLDDFFELIIARGTRTIINTTNAVEPKNGRSVVNCHDYWVTGKYCNFPNDLCGYRVASLPCGNIIRLPTKTAISIKDTNADEQRIGTQYTFVVVDNQGHRVKIPTEKSDQAERTLPDITLFHFEEWPDNGVPQDSSHLTEFLKIVHTHERNCRQNGAAAGPLTIHCSAGIGRSGVALATYHYIDRLFGAFEKGETLETIKVHSPAHMILEMRKCRPHMVQNEEQLLMIYQVLGVLKKDVVKAGKNFINSEAALSATSDERLLEEMESGFSDSSSSKSGFSESSSSSSQSNFFALSSISAATSYGTAHSDNEED